MVWQHDTDHWIAAASCRHFEAWGFVLKPNFIARLLPFRTSVPGPMAGSCLGVLRLRKLTSPLLTTQEVAESGSQGPQTHLCSCFHISGDPVSVLSSLAGASDGPRFPHLSDGPGWPPAERALLRAETAILAGGPCSWAPLWGAAVCSGSRLRSGPGTLVTATALAWPHHSTSCCRPKR